MSLTKHTDSKVIYLQVKAFSLWQELKKQVAGCDEIEVKNPKTGELLKKHGYRFDAVSGRVVKLIKYDTERKYTTRYFGFKIHFLDGIEVYVLDLPYNSQILRRFLRVAHNVDWNLPLSISVFKGKKKSGDGDELGVWFQQRGETVKPYYTREQPHEMPEAVFDADLQQWDFKAQHRWLVEKLKTETIPDIEAAAKRVEPPVEPQTVGDQQSEPQDTTDFQPSDFIVDDDVPF
jgi:hypothetical protein